MLWDTCYTGAEAAFWRCFVKSLQTAGVDTASLTWQELPRNAATRQRVIEVLQASKLKKQLFSSGTIIICWAARTVISCCWRWRKLICPTGILCCWHSGRRISLWMSWSWKVSVCICSRRILLLKWVILLFIIVKRDSFRTSCRRKSAGCYRRLGQRPISVSAAVPQRAEPANRRRTAAAGTGRGL